MPRAADAEVSATEPAPPASSDRSEAAAAAGTVVLATSLYLREGGGPVRLLTAGAARVTTVKLSVILGHCIFRGWSGASRWGLECLLPPAHPGGVGEGVPEGSASGPEPEAGRVGAEGQKVGTLAFALQGQEKQCTLSIARLLWDQDSPRSKIDIPRKASVPQLPACAGGAGRTKHWVTPALAAWSHRVVRTQIPPPWPGLGRLARFPGPGPPPRLLLGLEALLPPPGPGPPACGPGLGSLVQPPGPGPPQGPRGHCCCCSF
ncbi:uncharacterized protein LOC119706442 isoform X1 [Motacilla alba alba]|uniref:uncharacterized protein LOC119706442 isoform X1 n=1 Tax=Motacilla alba alba TaxID=1094192 RepID=UPI0018D57BBE|nr:uncharacterized protein LOC119706442 isoform X1 [Motacilla alba alba]XP_038006089.1 uncharacterized protein LOC119706442 isoform X1 [Motacilla alba alba]